MSEGETQAGGSPDPEQDEKAPEVEQEDLRRDIERTRAELGETVEALSHKTDVKAQAREKVDEAKAQAREKVEHAKTQAQAKAHDLQQKVPDQARERPIVPLAAGIGIALVALWLIRRR